MNQSDTDIYKVIAVSNEFCKKISEALKDQKEALESIQDSINQYLAFLKVTLDELEGKK